jgi:hypothetical protein
MKILTHLLLLNLLAGTAMGQLDWWDAEQSYYRIPIAEEGVYRLTGETLSDTDIPLADISAEEWELWREGERVPIYVGTVDGELVLEFAARGSDGNVDSLLMPGGKDDLLNPSYSMISDTAYYYLSWAAEGDESYETVRPENPPAEVVRRDFYLRTDKKVFSDDWVKPYQKISGANIYMSEFQRGEGFGAGPFRNYEGTVNAQNAVDGSAGIFRLRFIGDFGSHDFSLHVGSEIWEERRGSFEMSVADLTVGAAELQNPIEWSLEGRIDDRDRFYLAEWTLSYPSYFEEDALIQKGRIDTGGIALEGLSSQGDSAIYYDLTHELRYVFAPGQVSWLRESPGPHDFYAVKESAIRYLSPPEKMELDFSTDYLNSDYIIVTSKRLGSGSENPAIQAYADYRASDAGGEYVVSVVDVEDLYFTFGFGVPRHPISMRLFAQHLDTVSDEEPLIFIIGKGREYRDIRSPSALSSDLHKGFSVPTYGFPSSDHLLFAAPGASAPLFPVGRLAVEKTKEVWDYLDKIMLQETRPDVPLAENAFWRKKVLHLVGGGEVQPLITSYMENMGDRLEGSTWDPELLTFERGSSSSSERPLTDVVYDEINEGASLVTFFGHSATNSLGFDINIASKYKNRPRHPFLIALGCYGGNINTSQASVGEIYNSFEGGGFIGSIATSGPGEVTRMYLFARQMYAELGRLADQLTMAQIFHLALQDRENNDPRHVQQLMYFGDPALRIFSSKGPDYTFDASSAFISPQVINAGLDSFTVSVDLLNLGQNSSLNVEIQIDRIGPDGSLLDSKQLVAPTSGSRNTLTTKWAVGKEGVGGLNRLEFTIDPNREISEFPLPAARNNNDLQIGGVPGLPFFVFDNSAALAWPYQYAMIPTDTIKLVAYSTNPTARSADYLFQIDTTSSFQSPFLRDNIITDQGGRLEWVLPFNLEPEKVYYWRAALIEEEELDTLWKSSSFVHVPGREGWNQSHIGQWLESDSLFLNAGRYRLELPKEALNITIQNRVKGGVQTPNFVANGINVGSVNRAWDLVDEGIGICVIDTLIYTLQPNAPGGLYGSVNDNRTTRAFVYRTDSPESREAAVHFLDSIIPQNSHVFIFTIFDEEVAGQSLQIEDWAADTLVYGTSLIEALEKRGATALQNLMQEERQVYNFFYRQSKSGYQRLEEDFLFSTEDVLINSTTMGRRLPEGFFQTAPVELYSDTVEISVAFDKRQSGDSVRVVVLSPDEENQLETTKQDTLQWAVPPEISTISFFSQLMNFESRLAPDFKHLRVYQEDIPDYFWAPNLGEHKNDSVFYRGSEFEWASTITAVAQKEALDSLPLAIRIQNQGNVVYDDTLFTEEWKEEVDVSLRLPTADWPVGTYTLNAQINPKRTPVEKRYNNNVLSTSFDLIAEDVKPVLEVTFDDKILPQGALVRRTPNLAIKVRKLDGRVPIRERQLTTVLRQPDGSVYSLEADLSFQSIDSSRLVQGIWAAPLDLVQEGLYVLEVRYRPIGGSPLDELFYRLEFERKNERRIQSITLSPNPTDGDLFINYNLSGQSGPESWHLELMSAGGKTVWEREGDGAIAIGENRISLGQIPPALSSGMYLYRFRFFAENAVLFDGNNGQVQGALLLLRP